MLPGVEQPLEQIGHFIDFSGKKSGREILLLEPHVMLRGIHEMSDFLFRERPDLFRRAAEIEKAAFQHFALRHQAASAE